MKRIFLGWSKPLLELTADFLIQQHTDASGRIDLSKVTVVLPGSRANNRLEEILATRAATSTHKNWYPPEFLTLESLPEKFYRKKKPIADEILRCFAWTEAIRRLDNEDTELREQLLPTMPTNFDSRLALGRLLARLHYELTAEGLNFTDVAEACRKMKVTSEVTRWNALARLQTIYANDDPSEPGYLDQLGLWDLQAARLFAIEKQDPLERERIRTKLQKKVFYLVGLVDMNQLQKQILKNFDSFITPLVFAPSDVKDWFDEFGCLQVEAWCDTPIEICDKMIKIVLKPEHQADTVLREIAWLGNRYSSGQIIVSIQDKQVVPFLKQRFAQAGLPARLVEGTSLKQSGVYRLLEVLLKFLKTGLFKDYAEFVRHPDVEYYLQQQIGSSEHREFIKQLDVYYKARFPVFVPEPWKPDLIPDDRKFEGLQESWSQVKQLIDISIHNQTETLLLGEWFSKLRKMIGRLYPDHRNDPHTVTALDILLQKMESIEFSLQCLTEHFSFAEALQVFLTQIESEPIPPEEHPGTIEMIGWLETAMDDTPVALITGMNDGVIPSFANSDMFLPDELRKKLGLTDNRRRQARDAYYLKVLLETRNQSGKVVLIAGRRSTEGDPLLPSRFFFVSENTRKVSERVQRFFREIQPEIPVRLISSPRPGCDNKHEFKIPELPPLRERIKKISVSSLKEYKECPYRFYLKHCLDLRKIDDNATELDAADFGTLIHEVLRRFGEKKNFVRNSKSVSEIAHFLDSQLDEYVRWCYGETLMSTVEIQVERARARLASFAEWQANWCKSGYEIADVELKLDDTIPITVAGIQLKGQIDRIDRRCNEIIVLDYKTSDGLPDEKHLYKGDWIDFQLPLYQYILRESGYAEVDDTIRLGYITISKNIHNTRENMVDWDESIVQSGITEAKRLITEMATRDWSTVRPVLPPPDYSEDFAFICQDGIT